MPSENPYQNALDVQDACNLSGVVRQFARDTEKLWEEAREKGEGTDFVNTHPVVILYLDKLCDLAGYREFSSDGGMMDQFSKAYDACMEHKDD